MTEEEIKTLEELDATEVLENFTELINDLLKFKRNFSDSNEASLAERAEQFEGMLQKLEGDVRDHIATEHQLRLHMENSQSKSE